MSREHFAPSGAGRMVRLQTVGSPFHARILAARLGADGIVTQLRGNVGGPYPVGETSVWVPEGEAEVAWALLLADEVEATFLGQHDETPGQDDGTPGQDDGTPGRGGRPADRRGGARSSLDRRRRWARRALAGAGLVALSLAAVAAHAGF